MTKRIIKLLLIILSLLMIVFIYYLININYKIFIPCVFHEITGYYCPGCGITRCIFSIIRCDLYDAFCYNELVFILLPFLFIYEIYMVYLYIFDKKDNIINKIPNYIWIILIIIVITFGIIRNLDCFSFLQP